MYYFYVLENELGKLYFGSTSDLKRRLQEHQSGKNLTTKGYKWLLVYYEAYKDETDARTREKNVKNNGGSRKHLKNRIYRSRRFVD